MPPLDEHAIDAHAALVRNVHVPLDRQAPVGATVFLGDSHTEMLLVSAIAPLAVNHGVSGQSSEELLRSMELYPSLQRGSVVVVTTGTNDLNQRRSAGIGERYRAILSKIPSHVSVVVSSIPPNARHDARPVVNEARIACAADRRCTFVDAFASLSSDGLPLPGVLRADGVHLSDEGYRIWSEQLQRAIVTASHGMAGGVRQGGPAGR